jgi:hypothetical protein
VLVEAVKELETHLEPLKFFFRSFDTFGKTLLLPMARDELL